MPAGNTSSGHGSGLVLWCMQGVQLDHFIGSSYIKSTLICHPLCLFMWHTRGGTLSFYRPWLLPEQACIEAIHVACLVTYFIWNQLGIHIGPCKKKPEAPQKQSGPEEKLRAAGCQQGTPVVATAVACFMVYARGPAWSFYRLLISQVNPHLPPPVPFYVSCRGWDLVIL